MKNGACLISIDGKIAFDEVFRLQFEAFEPIPGATDLEPRMRDLTAEGVQKELVFGNSVHYFLHYPDLEVREWVFRIYNRYLADLQNKAPGRFYGVGIPNYWDMSKTRESIQEIKNLGLKAFLLPINPGKNVKGIENRYAGDNMEPLWAAAEESGLPICFHIGEAFHEGASVAVTFMANVGPAGFRKVFSELIFGGVFDRYPGLRVVFVESGIAWIASFIQDAELVAMMYRKMTDLRIKHSPGYYWRKHCYATFMTDYAGLRLLDFIGADRVMWSGDYPHPESTFGYGWKSMQAVLDAVDEKSARLILGDTATKVFDLA